MKELLMRSFFVYKPIYLAYLILVGFIALAFFQFYSSKPDEELGQPPVQDIMPTTDISFDGTGYICDLANFVENKKLYPTLEQPLSKLVFPLETVVIPDEISKDFPFLEYVEPVRAELNPELGSTDIYYRLNGNTGDAVCSIGEHLQAKEWTIYRIAAFEGDSFLIMANDANRTIELTVIVEPDIAYQDRVLALFSFSRD